MQKFIASRKNLVALVISALFITILDFTAGQYYDSGTALPARPNVVEPAFSFAAQQYLNKVRQGILNGWR